MIQKIFNMNELITNTQKVCSKCKVEKPLEQFRKCKSNRDGFMNFCRECHSLDSKEKYAKNKELRLAQIDTWQQENPHKIDKYNSKYRAKQKKEKRKLKQELKNRPELLTEEVIEKIEDGQAPNF